MFAAGLSAPDIQWAQLVPLLVLLGGACVLLLSTLAGSLPRWVAPSLTIATTFAALVVSAVRWNELYYNKGSYLVADAIAEDRFSMFATIVILVAVVCAALLMSSHHDNANGDALENYALLLTSAIGAIVMVAAHSWRFCIRILVVRNCSCVRSNRCHQHFWHLRASCWRTHHR